jgi:hypothetical protein
MKTSRISQNKPLSSRIRSPRLLSRVSAFAVLLALGVTRSEAVATFEGNSVPTPGDGQSWLDPLNWSFDALPLATDDVIFGSGITGPIQLGGNQTTNSLVFNSNASLGSRGDGNLLTNSTGIVSVGVGVFATINSKFAGTAGLSLSGGGTLHMNNIENPFTGNIFVDGAGTTLLTLGFAQPAATNRSDLGFLGQNTRTVNLTNGGTFKIAGNSYNPDGATKIIALGTGGGAINVAAGYQHYTLDDAGQITAIAGSALTKTGNGSLQITSQDYNLDLSGGVNVDGGLLRLSRVQGNTANGRFSAFTVGSAITINSGGKLVIETGTVGFLDNNLTLNPGGVLAINGAEHNIGLRDGGPSILTLNGGTILVRDGFNPQSSGRLPRFDARMVGSGVVDLIGGTANAGNSRMVLQRSDVGSTFSGTFVVHGNTALEQNQRDNDTGVDTGNTLGNATVDLRGHNAVLDLRDSTAGTSNLGGYSANNLILSGETGSIGRVSVNRSTTAAGTGNVYQFNQFTTGCI